MEGFTEFKIKTHIGYLGDFQTEWWTDEDWEKHRAYVEKCKNDGTYGKEVEITVLIKDHPLFSNSNWGSDGVILHLDSIERHEFKPFNMGDLNLTP